MRWDRIEGHWPQSKLSAKQQWGRLSDAQLDAVAGQRDRLASQLQETYGLSKDEAGKQLYDWQKLQKDTGSSKS